MGRGSVEIDEIIRVGIDLPETLTAVEIAQIAEAARQGGTSLRRLFTLLEEHDDRQLVIEDRKLTDQVASAMIVGQLAEDGLPQDGLPDAHGYAAGVYMLFGYVTTDGAVILAAGSELFERWHQHTVKALQGIRTANVKKFSRSYSRQLQSQALPVLAPHFAATVGALDEKHQTQVLFRQAMFNEPGKSNYDRALERYLSMCSLGKLQGTPTSDTYQAAFELAWKDIGGNLARAQKVFFMETVVRTWPALAERIADVHFGRVDFHFRKKMQEIMAKHQMRQP